jgi:hypothetical protein
MKLYVRLCSWPGHSRMTRGYSKTALSNSYRSSSQSLHLKPPVTLRQLLSCLNINERAMAGLPFLMDSKPMRQRRKKAKGSFI